MSKKVNEKAFPIAMLREILKEKIKINMREREIRGWSIPQVYAISLAQVKKLFNSDKKKDKAELLRIYIRELLFANKVNNLENRIKNRKIIVSRK